jgi:hypothetical protein
MPMSCSCDFPACRPGEAVCIACGGIARPARPPRGFTRNGTHADATALAQRIGTLAEVAQGGVHYFKCDGTEPQG